MFDVIKILDEFYTYLTQSTTPYWLNTIGSAASIFAVFKWTTILIFFAWIYRLSMWLIRRGPRPKFSSPSAVIVETITAASAKATSDIITFFSPFVGSLSPRVNFSQTALASLPVSKTQPQMRIAKAIKRSYAHIRSGGDQVFITIAAILLIGTWSWTIQYFIHNKPTNILYYLIGGVVLISTVDVACKFTLLLRDLSDSKLLWQSYEHILDQDYGTANLSSGYVKRRVELIRENRDDLSCLHELLPAAASIDSEKIENGYTSLLVYAWVLPVIGFIGTALGLSDAIASFAQGNLSNAEFDQHISTVIAGISQAFIVSVIALCGSVVVYICARALRSLDQSIINLVNYCCLDILSAIPVYTGSATSDLSSYSIVGKLDLVAARLLDVVKIAAALDNITTHTQEAMEELHDILRRLTKSTNEVHESHSGLSETAISAAESLRIASEIWKRTIVANYRGISPQSHALPRRPGKTEAIMDDERLRDEHDVGTSQRMPASSKRRQPRGARGNDSADET